MGAVLLNMDPDIDFDSLFAEFDTVLMGCHTLETVAQGGSGTWLGMKTFAFSRTLRQAKLARLKMTGHKVYKTGIISLEYAVE